jgi:hypothetical protein
MSEVKAFWSYQIKYEGGAYKRLLDQATQEGLKAVEPGRNLYQAHRALSLAYVNNDDFPNARKINDEEEMRTPLSSPLPDGIRS